MDGLATGIAIAIKGSNSNVKTIVSNKCFSIIANCKLLFYILSLISHLEKDFIHFR